LEKKNGIFIKELINKYIKKKLKTLVEIKINGEKNTQ
jgi:hypothetical protein